MISIASQVYTTIIDYSLLTIMKKYIFGTVLMSGIFMSLAYAIPVEAAPISETQVHFIIQLLQTMGIDQSTIASVESVLSAGGMSSDGNGSSSGTGLSASFLVNGQSSATNVNPLSPRTWSWSSSGGSSYRASAVISGCESAAQNGVFSPWTPWTTGSGTASNGSTTAVPGAGKYGCTITGNYTVTNSAGQTATSNASVTFRSSAGGASSGLTITTPAALPKFKKGQNPYIQFAYTGGSGTPTWSIVSGALPHDLYFDTTKGTIEGNRIAIDNNPARGVVTFTVRVTVGSQSATKQFSIEEMSASDPRPVASNLTYNVYTNAYLQQIGDHSINFASSIAYTTNETCSVVSGQLPPGTAMNSACKITGIPTTVGTYSIVYRVQNQSGSDTGNITIGVTNPARIRILTNYLPEAKVGQAYTAQIVFQADPGVGYYQSGDRVYLPPGLSYAYTPGTLSASIQGIPTEAGTYSVPVSVSAGGNTNIGETKVFQLVVRP